MEQFNFNNRTEIIFGAGRHREIGSLVKPYASKILLHYGGGSIKATGLYDEVMESLSMAGIEVLELSGAKPNPRLGLVYEGIELCRKEGIEFILAVGGGSAIDSAKAIALGVHYEGDVWELFETGKEPKTVLNVATILTLPATGTEASDSAVITKEDGLLKVGYSSDRIRPVFSIMNPELFTSLPQNQIANGVCDMMSHIFERYFTNTTHTDLTDGLCETTLKTIMKNAKLLRKDPTNLDAWSEVSFAGTIAHNGLLGLGRQQDWACHKMEHELSALYDVAHGAGLAVMTPAWMRYVYQSNLNMFLQFATKVMGVEGSFREPEAIVLEGINRLEQFFIQMGLPITMKELGIPDSSNFELMAKKATKADGPKGERPIGGLRKLNQQDVLKIYYSAV